MSEYSTKLSDTWDFTKDELCGIIDICIGVKFPSFLLTIRDITEGESNWDKLAISKKNTKKIMPLSSAEKTSNIIDFILKYISFYKPQKITSLVKYIS